MKLKILGQGYFSSSSYFGVERPAPSYIAEIADSEEPNQIFYRYLREANQCGIVQDLNFAQELVKAYQFLKPPQYFEIVEITSNDEPPEIKSSEFLGFDIACVYRISVLSWALKLDHDPPALLKPDDLIWNIRPLLRLLEAYFAPRLNQNGLFGEYEVAHFCFDCMMGLQKIRPNLWEGEDCRFEILGLWRILQ